MISRFFCWLNDQRDQRPVVFYSLFTAMAVGFAILFVGPMIYADLEQQERERKTAAIQAKIRAEYSQAKTEAQAWKNAFVSFYGYTKASNWRLATPYAELALAEAHARVLQRELGWSDRERLQWQLSVGPKLAKDLLRE